MERVTQLRTFDGKMHSTIQDANRHLDVLHAESLSGVAHKMVKLTKYVDIAEFIDHNLFVFAAIQRIKDDYILQEDENE
jgi:hypothetical protein